MFTPGAHWSYKWQSAQMLLFLLENDRYYSSAPKCVCQQCHNSQHSSSKPVCSLHGRNEQMADKVLTSDFDQTTHLTTGQLLGFFEL